MAEPNKLEQFEAELRAQHDALTKAYEEAHVAGEAAWAKVEETKRPLVAFRAKYGRVLKALDAGAVKVED